MTNTQEDHHDQSEEHHETTENDGHNESHALFVVVIEENVPPVAEDEVDHGDHEDAKVPDVIIRVGFECLRVPEEACEDNHPVNVDDEVKNVHPEVSRWIPPATLGEAITPKIATTTNVWQHEGDTTYAENEKEEFEWQNSLERRKDGVAKIGTLGDKCGVTRHLSMDVVVAHKFGKALGVNVSGRHFDDTRRDCNGNDWLSLNALPSDIYLLGDNKYTISEMFYVYAHTHTHGGILLE